MNLILRVSVEAMEERMFGSENRWAGIKLSLLCRLRKERIRLREEVFSRLWLVWFISELITLG